MFNIEKDFSFMIYFKISFHHWFWMNFIDDFIEKSSLISKNLYNNHID
jgi:hypothetical protein